MSSNDVHLPDIGDFKNVPVIEVSVSPGDVISVDDVIIVLESDKATMDIPSPVAGTVAEVRIKPGDTVSQGDLILVMAEAANAGAGAPKPTVTDTTRSGAPASAPGGAPAAMSGHAPGEGQAGYGSSATATGGAAPAPAPKAAAPVSGEAMRAQVLVIGAGPGGYTAAFRAADLGQSVVLVERWPSLGGVCLNVGCIPSKALLHAAKVIDESHAMAAHGISFAAPQIDIDKLRAWKDGVVQRLTGGLTGLAKQRKVTVVTGEARFVSPNQVAVEHEGQTRIIGFDHAIIAAGSEPVQMPFIPHDDPRVLDSTGALELDGVPARLLVIGGGIIGLEMATVYHALGAKVTIVELMDQIIPGADKDLVTPLMKRISKQYEAIHLKAKVTAVEATPQGLKVSFEGGTAPASDTFDKVLVSVGRRPNGQRIGAEAAGVAVDARGFIAVDRQMRTNVPHIFAIGDVVGQPMLAHKATHEGKVAAEVAAGKASAFDAKVIPSVAYTDPEVAWVGMTETEAKAKGVKVGKGVFPWAASGRSLALGREEGLTKVLFDPETDRILGCGIVGPSAGDLIAEAALAIELGADAEDIGLTIHPHPTLSETIGLAAEAFEGTITDLYMPRKDGPKRAGH
ncbi:dihydrolipoamide dehydrogenase [Methylobacterium sp. Leaf125]|uniref:dihydrolipoyl dehydrogenase n=1 Tax=Methylobacterium sp. Leaf125 TaxID=1736265 RepID=UPI0006FEA916|nr:dihydrolipoyl dehydrogenase [Methylobacterium sp. Leaf125]KQQ48024.1 dihydrolipoamide dehydrogenase [Methylobacterium sp. Leaf125]